MARTLKVLLNIGLDHQKEYGIPDAKADEVVTVGDREADIMVGVLKVAKEHNPQEEEKHRKEIEEFDLQVEEQTLADEVRREEMRAKVKTKMDQRKNQRPQVRNAVTAPEPEKK